jgi:hypothetical protein
MVAVTGGAGMRKTHATEAECASLPPEDVVYLSCAGAPTRREFAYLLAEALTGSEPPRAGTRNTYKRMIVGELRRDFRLLVLDEAQALDLPSFGLCRELLDDPDLQVGIVLVGGQDAWERISANDPIVTRVHDQVDVVRMSPEQVLRVIPQFHAVWEAAEPQDILLIDDSFASGRWRLWANATVHAKRECAKRGIDTVDAEVADLIVERLAARA